jgi:hypothetical protein
VSEIVAVAPLESESEPAPVTVAVAVTVLAIATAVITRAAAARAKKMIKRDFMAGILKPDRRSTGKPRLGNGKNEKAVYPACA